jgi:hypothetical protein
MNSVSDTIDDLLPDPEDTPRDEALARAFTAHDAMTFDGKPIRPVSAGSMAMLQRTRNGLIFGDSSNLLFDAAGFVIIHTDDETLFKSARRAAWSADWPAYVIDWLDAVPDAQAKLTLFAPKIAELMNDYGQALTTSLENHSTGNAGGRIG